MNKILCALLFFIIVLILLKNQYPSKEEFKGGQASSSGYVAPPSDTSVPNPTNGLIIFGGVVGGFTMLFAGFYLYNLTKRG